MTAWKYRLYGVVLIGVIAGLLGLSIAVFNRAFTDTVEVTLAADTTGNQLPHLADVKLRGVMVGQVSAVDSTGGGSEITLAIDPAKAALVPANVTARLLPKTLFGERYVALQIPAEPAAPIVAGDHIRQDVSGNAVQVTEVLDSLLPLFKAVPPQDLSATLGALAQALSGRGEQLGATFDNLDAVLKGINPHIEDVKADIAALADVSETYAQVLPDVVSALEDLRTTNTTIIEREGDLNSLYDTVIGNADIADNFLEQNQDTLISLTNDSLETLTTVASSSGIWVCTLKALRKHDRLLSEAFGAGSDRPGLHATIEFNNSRGPYLPNQDEPVAGPLPEPTCMPEVNPAEGNFPDYPTGAPSDGSYKTPSRNARYNPAWTVYEEAIAEGNLPYNGLGYAGSTMEQSSLRLLLSGVTGELPDSISGWRSLILAPALRGGEVTIK